MIKRIFDIFLSIVLLVLLLPVFFLTTAIIILFLGRPVIFKQERVGLNNQLFTIYKFRTMKNLNHLNIHESESRRITSIGRFFRSTSLDELPELVNVLIGNMSFVGPRPLLAKYLSLYSKEQLLRHQVQPGITGWAQVNGRNSLSWEDKFKYDIFYVNNRSFFFDLKIILLTLKILIIYRGANSSDTELMPEFKGSQPNIEAENK